MKNKKRILFIMQVPPPITGATLRNSELLDIISEEDEFSIRIIPISLVKQVSRLSSFSIKKIFSSFMLYLKTLRYLIFFRPHIVYMTPVPTGYAFWRDLLLILILKVSRKKMVYHLRPLGYSEISAGSRFRTGLNRFIFRNVSVICLSNSSARDIEGLIREDPYILNNGIGSLGPQNSKKERRNLVALFFSNLLVAKGIFDFLDMMSILKTRGEKFEGRIYGEEGDVSREELETQIEKMGLGGSVSYKGGVSGQRRNKVYHEADIFVFPTHRENFPGVVLEAMQSSLPVVSVFEGSIPEIVKDGETGFLHNKKDNISAASSIAKLLNDESLRKKMGLAGKAVYKEKFSSEVFRNNFLNLLKNEIVNRS